MRSTFVCLTTLTLLLGACPADDSDDTNASDTDPTGDTNPTTTSPTTTSPTTTSPTTTEPSTTETDPSTTETDPTDPTDATESSGPDPDTGSESGGNLCPPEEGDDECSMCTKTNCCPELMACQANADCDCAVDCISEMGIGMQDACLEMCMVKELPAEGTALQTCVVVSQCLGVCG
jgi:hypothetical protein